MNDLNIGVFIGITVVTLFLWWLFKKGLPNYAVFPISVITISYFVYCGVGLSWVENGENYILKYLIYLFTLFFTLMIVLAYKQGGKLIFGTQNQDEAQISNWENIFHSYNGFYKLCTFLLFICYLTYLIIPENRLMDIIMPPIASLPKKIALVSQYNEMSLFSLIDILITLLTPFFLLNIQTLLTEKKKIRVISLIIFWIYLDYLRFSYLGRNEIIRYMIFVFFIFIYLKEKKTTIKWKYVLPIIVAMIICLPFLVKYTFERQGLSFNGDIGVMDAVDYLLESETYYPQYYDEILEADGIISVLQYMLWLIFIPVPSMLWSGKPTVVVNDAFTTYIFGTHRGEAGYSIELPSLLGEAMFVFGEYGYFLHAIVIGLIVGIMIKFYSKYKSLDIIYLYFSVLLLVCGRGGTGSFVPNLINGSVSVILWIFFLKSTKRKKITKQRYI